MSPAERTAPHLTFINPIKQLVMASQSLPTFSPDMLTRMEPGMLTDEMKEGKTQQHTPIVLLDAGRWLRARASAPHNCVI